MHKAKVDADYWKGNNINPEWLIAISHFYSRKSEIIYVIGRSSDLPPSFYLPTFTGSGFLD